MSDNQINIPLNLYDGDSFPWQIQEDGSVSYGYMVHDPNTDEEYFQLYGSLTNNYYGYDDVDAYTEDDGREVVIDSRFIGDGYGGDLPISVSRKIYVSEDESFVRFLDIVTNTGSQRQTYNFTVGNYLYLQSSVVKTSSDDNIFTLNDNWLVLDSIDQEGSLSNTFDMLQVIAGSGGYRPSSVSTSTSSTVDFTYNLDLAPGETQIIMHFAAQNSNAITAFQKGDDLALLGMNALAGMSDAEKSQVINFNTGVNYILASDLLVLNHLAPNAATTGEKIIVSFNVKNNGNKVASDYWYDAIYISNDATFDSSDISVFQSSYYYQTPLAVNSSYQVTGYITIPKITPGQKYLLFVTDAGNYQIEINKSNNVLAVPIEIKAPDLAISSLTNINTVTLGEKVSLSWTVTNQGDVAAQSSWYDYVYISSDTQLDGNDTYVTNKYINVSLDPLAPNSSYSTNLDNIEIPKTQIGNRYLLFVTNYSYSQADTNEANNVFAVPIEIKAPDLQVLGVQTPQALSWGETFSVSWNVVNQSDVAAPAKWYDSLFVSHDNILDNYDYFVGDKYIDNQTPLAAGASYTTSANFTMPSVFIGNQYLLFVADRRNYQGETNENNNVYAVPIEIKAPDLKISQVQAPSTAIPGQKISVSWTVENQGNGAALTDWYDYVWLSSNNTFESGQDTLLTTENIASMTPLDASSSYTINKDITIPTTAKGTQYLLFMADGYSGGYYSYRVQPETNESNNIYAVPIQIGAPDLTFASAPQVPDTAILGGTISVNWTVKNQGNIAALANWSDNIYISNNTTFDNTDTFLGSQVIDEQTPLAANGTYTINNKILSIPTTATGQRYLLFITDTGNNQSESNESNNIYAVPINVKAPDLTISQAEAPSTGTWGETISVSWTVKNMGDVAAPADWYDRIYISSDTIFDFTDKPVIDPQNVGEKTPLAPGATYKIDQKINIPTTVSGDQYLLFVVDDSKNQGETNEANNTYAVPIRIGASDLLVKSVATQVPNAQFGQTLDVTWTVRNAGVNATIVNWSDRIWLSTDGTFNNAIPLLTVPFGNDLPLAPNSEYTKTATVTLPLNPSLNNGNYYILVQTDAFEAQPEFNESNNSKTSQPIALALPPIPDLKVSSVIAPVEGLSGQQLEISWILQNQGTGDATGRWDDNIFLSNDSVVGGDQYFGSFSFEGTIAVGQSITRKQLIELPNDLSGNRWVVVQTDANNQVYEHANESNNIAISQQPINISLSPFPNLQVSSVTAPPTAFSSQQTVIEWTVTNTGTGSTSAPIWYDAVWLSLDDQFDSSDIYLGNVENATYLNVNESYTNRLTVTLPENVDGNYHFLVKTDYNAQVYELENEGDNFGASDTSRIELTPPPDLQPTAVIAPSQTFSGQTMTLNWTVTNNGPGRTSQYSWYDEIYMSADNVLDGSDRYLGQLYHGGDLNVGESYNASRNVTLPIGVSGDFYFFVKTDAGNSVHELAYEANNAVHQPTPTTVRLTPPPDLEVELVNSPALALASHPLTINYRVVNYGATATPNYAWTDAIYLSADTQFDKNTDILLGDVKHYGFLDAGEFYNGSATFTLPNGLNGTFYTFVVTDKGNEVFELNKTNNVGFDTSTLAVSSRPADLVISAVGVTTSVEAGKTTQVSWTVTNQGIGDTAVNSWTDKIIASIDTVLGNNDDIFLASFRHSGTFSLIDGSYMSGLLNPGDSYSRSELVSIPFNMIGNYNLFVTTDANGQVYEATAENNNSTSGLVTVNRQTPDLQITDVNAPTAAISGNKLTVNWTTQNFGIGRTNAYSWYDSVYLSSDSILNEQQDIYLGQVFHSGALNPLAQYNGTGTFNLPIDLTGDYYVIIRTDKSSDRDYDNRVLEDPLENNNYQATTTPTAISLGSVPNLVVQSVDAPLVGISGQLFNLSWTVRNDGADTGYKPWYDAIYLSRDQIFDRSSDIYLDYRNHAGGLAAGQSYTENQLFKIPQGLSGPLYVFVVTDGGNQIYERSGEGNNVGYDGNSIQVNLPAPTDLTVGSITIPVNAVPGQNATISYTVNNLGPNAAQGIWYDSIYISADDKWDINDTFFGRIQLAGYVPAAGSYSPDLTAPLPGVIPGDYHVIVRSDIRNAIVESNENNNIGASLDQVAIDAEALQLGGFDSGTLFQGQSVYYKINVVAGETLQVKFDSASDDGFNELYIRYGEMPSLAEFDYGFENVTADQQVIVPFTEAGTYYVLARAVKAPDWVSNVVIDENTTVSGLANNYTIEAKTIDFGITSIGQTVGDRAGKVTIEIFGAKFNQLMTAELIDASGDSIIASDIWFEDSTDVFATFDLSNAAIGTYDLKVSEPSLSQTANGDITPIISNILEDGFRVVDARADDVLVTVTSTPAVSPGQSFDIIVSYANRGTHDVTAPVIVVNADHDIRLQNIQDSDEFAQFGSIALLGISNEGQAGILRAGETGVVRLRGTAPSFAGSVNITARQMLDDGTPINYGDFIEYLGGDISDNSWAAATTALQNEFGNSWTSFQAGLGKRATELAKIGDYTHSATELWTDVALDAWGRAYLNNLPTTSPESSLLTPNSSIQAENATVIDNGLSEINNNTQLLFNTVTTESSTLELNNNVQSFGFEPSPQFSNENLQINQALTVNFPLEEIFETVEAIAKSFGYPEDAVVGIKVPGVVETIGRTGPEPETLFDFTITLDDITNPTLADILDDLAGVNPAVDISSYALDIASSVDFDKNNIRGLLSLLEPYTDASKTLAQRINLDLDDIADYLALIHPFSIPFDTLMQRVEQAILATAMQFKDGDLIPFRPEAPTAAAFLRHFVGELGPTPENLANDYEESVKLAIYTANPLAPLWFTNEVIKFGKIYGAEWKTFTPTYPFAPNPTGHVHIDDDYALGTAIPNTDLVQIPNEIVLDISESLEYKSAIDALKKKLDLAVERGFFYTVIEAGFQGPARTDIKLTEGETSHTFNFQLDQSPIISLENLLYNPAKEISDFYEDTDVLLALGQINKQYAVVNSITITESSNKRNYTADISVLGIDSYSWQLDDRGNSSKILYNLTGIDPVVFEYVWLTQQYGYGQPFTVSYQIDEITSGSVPIPDNSPPENPPTPPSDEPFGNPNNPSFPFNPFDPGHSTTNIIVSQDPNDILGPQGYGAERWISATDPLNYTIRFENDPELATAPAQVVRITQQLDSDLDFRTFRLGDFGFGDTFIDVPDNRAFYQTRLDLTATKGIYVDVTAGVDIATGQAFWEFTSIDPATGVEPTNPLLGFLPPDLTSPEGEGFVSYSVRPKSSIENGAVIDAQARIIFDINEPIDTPAISNTIDTGKPTSTVNALPSNTNDTSFQVTWSGSDNTGGSALADFTIYVSDNGKSFVPWLQNTTFTEATFTGQAGHTYAFYSVARDNAGNAQEVPTQSQASTQVANSNNNPGLAVNQGLTLNEEGTADITTTQLQITDADNTAAQIIYTLTNLPIHGSLKVNGTALTISNTFTQADIDNNRLTYTHDGSETTSDSFNFTVVDGAGGTIDSTIFNITVNPVNDAPTLEKAIAFSTATEDSAFSFTIESDTFKDVDAGDYLTYSATIENGNSLPSWLTFDAVTGSFNGIPGNADVGSLNLKVTATDTNGAVVADTFTLTVANVNDAPTLEKQIVNQTVIQDTTFSFSFAEDTFKDVDVDDSLSYSATLENGSPLPSWLTFDTATRAFNGTPGNADVGNIRVKLVALDKTGATATATFGLEVIKLNNAPVATDDAAITLENQAVTISATKLLVNDKDIDGDILKISNVGNAISGNIAFNQNGDVVFTPATNFTGKATFEYTVSDANGGSDTAQVIVNVNPDNNIKGTSGRDVLTGNNADNIITGFQGQDILTGGGGNDQFVYTNIRDAGDTITDFQVGSDKIVITELLKSLGYSGSNPIADSYVKFGSSGNNAILQIDPDGLGSQRPTSLVTLQNLTVAQLNNTDNFLF